ncbi:sulfide dehydrogenase [flavocytochrome c] flavoprotein chain [Sulfurivirga caldicuralii]|uniref:Sulfide dehydrogenase [flavocytochrome c] flavoprotein chain n=1 Tax=Sulfurivirga caldicuralii TaxID=364032 RepID=A0A1N6GSR7_9GAMM|nr:FAD-dependent oxidoreductase [Sulfurivirga caldicuralii]SIO10610.1 sulfide dehydrogenase [flavocytochrome c] flavoprotein chain [Sulfurivirga caldicuralii]
MLLTRRDLIKLFGASAATAALGVSPKAFSASAPHLVIVGGGVGGTATAKYMRMLDPSIRITLIEPNREYVFCPGSNEVLNDEVTLAEQTVTYDSIRNRYGVNVVLDKATAIDYDKKTVRTAKGERIAYDWLVVSPGPDFVFDAVEGYSRELAEGDFPHAWKAGPQTLKLKKLYQGMRTGGVVVISAPPMPYRCPPAPYERASFMAEWLKEHNPTAKILILDSKPDFIFQPHYETYWKEKFGYGTDNAMIEWVGEHNGGKVVSLDPNTRSVKTADGETIKADVINIIPVHKAGKFAFDTGLTMGKQWVPINPFDFRSKVDKNVFVIGDTTEADPMVKTGYLASNQAKWVAQVILAEMTGKDPGYPLWTNNCVAMAGEDFGMTITDTFRYHDGKIELQETIQSPVNLNPHLNAERVAIARNWQRTFRRDIFE